MASIGKNQLSDIYAKVENFIQNLAIIVLFLMMVLTVLNAFGRYLFHSPISGTVSFIELYLMMALIWFTAINIQSERSNIQLDIFAEKFENRTRMVIQLIYQPVVLLIFIILFSAALNTTLDRFAARAVTSGSVQFPTYISWGILATGIGGLCLVLFRQVVRDIYEVVIEGL